MKGYAYAQAAGEQAQRLTGLLEELKQVAGRHQTYVVQAKDEVAKVRLRLAELYLPDLQPDTLDAAYNATRFDGLRDRLPLKEKAQEKIRLEKRIADLEADERVAHAPRYIHPDAGELIRSLREAHSFLEPWEQQCSRIEAQPKFEDLYLIGYGTPVYPYRFYNWQFYADWRDADQVYLALGKESFEEVLAEYNPAVSERDRWREQVASLNGRIQEIMGMLEALKEVRTRQENLDTIWLQETRQALALFTERMALKALEVMTTDPAIHAQLVAIGGAQAKVEYLQAFADERLKTETEALEKNIGKLRRDSVKYARSKNTYLELDQNVVGPRLADPYPRYRDRWGKIDKQAQRVLQFNHYSVGRLSDDFLWWDVMLDGRHPGDFIPGVRSFRSSHPGYAYQRPAALNDDWDQAAVAAFADSSGPDTLGDAS